ncbi:glucose-6-phosphate 1-dehydrogenase [compost metagenome]
MPDAYEQVIVDAIRGHKNLFTSSAEVLRSWEILQPIQDAWNMDNEPLKQYSLQSRVEDII